MPPMIKHLTTIAFQKCSLIATAIITHFYALMSMAIARHAHYIPRRRLPFIVNTPAFCLLDDTPPTKHNVSILPHSRPPSAPCPDFSLAKSHVPRTLVLTMHPLLGIEDADGHYYAMLGNRRLDCDGAFAILSCAMGDDDGMARRSRA